MRCGAGERCSEFLGKNEHCTNISILEEIGLERVLMGKVARMILQYFGHVTRGSAGNLALTVLEGSIDGLRPQGRPKRQWMDDIEEWSGCSYIQLKDMSQDRDQWRRKTIEWHLQLPTVIDDGRLVSE